MGRQRSLHSYTYNRRGEALSLGFAVECQRAGREISEACCSSISGCDHSYQNLCDNLDIHVRQFVMYHESLEEQCRQVHTCMPGADVTTYACSACITDITCFCHSFRCILEVHVLSFCTLSCVLNQLFVHVGLLTHTHLCYHEQSDINQVDGSS